MHHPRQVEFVNTEKSPTLIIREEDYIFGGNSRQDQRFCATVRLNLDTGVLTHGGPTRHFGGRKRIAAEVVGIINTALDKLEMEQEQSPSHQLTQPKYNRQYIIGQEVDDHGPSTPIIRTTIFPIEVTTSTLIDLFPYRDKLSGWLGTH